jgi:hypothetical protein
VIKVLFAQILGLLHGTLTEHWVHPVQQLDITDAFEV